MYINKFFQVKSLLNWT